MANTAVIRGWHYDHSDDKLKLYMNGNLAMSVDKDGLIENMSISLDQIGFTPGAAIGDLSLSGTYTDDDDGIQAAINGILATMRANGLIASS